jgi:hypothetical protein
VKTVSQGLVVFAGLIAAPVVPTGQKPHAPAPRNPVDSRVVRLQQFLQARDCPVSKYAADFIRVADRYDLDWRLLPSISMVESSGGKAYTKNNIFGWANCREGFPSVRAGIEFVASRFAKSKLYRDKDVDAILRTYNPSEDYAGRVKYIMARIDAHKTDQAASID